MSRRYDVVVVGAGASGCALAARLSENPERSVLLIEAGPVPAGGEPSPTDAHLAGSLRSAAPGHLLNWDYPSSPVPGRAWGIARGKTLGGSMAINGGYFVRAHPHDFDDWAAASGDHPARSRWSYSNALPILRALETDIDYPEAPLHGGSGPMPIARAWTRRPREGASGPLDEAFLTAALSHGATWESDKNAGGLPGVGPIPMNVVHGVRRHPGMQYVGPAQERPNLEVRGNTHALRVRFRGTRAVGVEVRAAAHRDAPVELIESGEVVLAAGAIATPHLLLLSGVGPATHLRGHGVQVHAERPGVGRGVSEHPDLSLPLLVRPDLRPTHAATAFTLAWNFSTRLEPVDVTGPGAIQQSPGDSTDARGDIEILLTSLPSSELFGAEGERAGRAYSLMVGLQHAESTGLISLRSKNPSAPPNIDYRLLSAEEDLARLSVGVSRALQLLQAEPMRELLVQPVHERMEALMHDADAWQSWLRANIGLRFHTCGGAQMGPEALDASVTSSSGLVYGVEGLRIADLSLLPRTPSRGPANTAVFIGETIARAMA